MLYLLETSEEQVAVVPAAEARASALLTSALQVLWPPHSSPGSSDRKA